MAAFTGDMMVLTLSRSKTARDRAPGTPKEATPAMVRASFEVRGVPKSEAVTAVETRYGCERVLRRV